MRFPTYMPEGGKIGFVAPSFGCATEPYISTFKAAQEKWVKRGYGIHLGPNCYASDGLGISSTPQNCGTELTNEYCSSQSDVLISCGGGELMCEILDYVDFEKIEAASPKWFMGYSDNTNFTFTLATICDVASIYGPCAASFGSEEDHQAHIDAFSILTTDSREFVFSGYDKWEKESLRDDTNPYAAYNLTEPSVPRRFVGHGKSVDELNMQGRLLGGCLDCLVNLCGTRFDHVSQFNQRYANDGVIWFLEACDLNPMSIRRAMWELEHAGWFDNVAGFIIGRPLCFGEEMMGVDQYNAVYDIVGHHNVPILMDVDLGHLPPSVPFITGSYAQVHSVADTWDIRMKLKEE